MRGKKKAKRTLSPAIEIISGSVRFFPPALLFLSGFFYSSTDDNTSVNLFKILYKVYEDGEGGWRKMRNEFETKTGKKYIKMAK